MRAFRPDSTIRSESLILSLATIAAFALHPSPVWCIDCEFPNPWGHVADRIDGLLFVWSLVAPFFAGSFGFRRGWVVPLAVVLANLISQLLGGEPWGDFLDNEGPGILFFGSLFYFGSFGLGWFVRAMSVSLGELNK